MGLGAALAAEHVSKFYSALIIRVRRHGHASLWPMSVRYLVDRQTPFFLKKKSYAAGQKQQ